MLVDRQQSMPDVAHVTAVLPTLARGVAFFCGRWYVRFVVLCVGVEVGGRQGNGQYFKEQRWGKHQRRRSRVVFWCCTKDSSEREGGGRVERGGAEEGQVGGRMSTRVYMSTCRLTGNLGCFLILK